MPEQPTVPTEYIAPSPVPFEVSMRRAIVLLAPVLLAFVTPPVRTVAAQDAARRPLRATDIYQLREVRDPQLSPDGTSILYSVSTASLDENRRVDMTYRLSLVTGTPVPFPDDSTRASATLLRSAASSMLSRNQTWFMVAIRAPAAISSGPQRAANLLDRGQARNMLLCGFPDRTRPAQTSRASQRDAN